MPEEAPEHPGRGWKGTFQRLIRGLWGPAGVYLVASALGKAGVIFLIPLYTRRLTLEEYGDFAVAQSILAILPNFLSLGLTAAVARFYYDDADLDAARRNVGSVARWLIAFDFAIALIVQLVLLVVPLPLDGIFSRWALSYMLWGAVGATLASVPSVYLKAAQRPILAASFPLVQFVTTTICGILLVGLFARSLRGAIEAAAGAQVVVGVVSLLFILLALPGGLDRRVLGKALRFSLPFIPHYSARQGQQVADRWILKGFSLEAVLGGYALAGQLTAPIALALNAWNDADTPRMGELYRRGGVRAIRGELNAIARSYVAVAVVSGAAIILAIPLARLLVGDEFVRAFWIIPLLGGIFVVDSLYFPFANVVFFASRTEMIPRVTISAVAVNVALNVLLIPTIGVSGALAAQGVAIAFRSAAMWFAARRCLQIPPQ